MDNNFSLKKIKYDIDQIIGYWELNIDFQSSVLHEWLSVNVAANYQIPAPLERKRQRLEQEGSLWNEEELKMHFLASVFEHADLDVPQRIKLFYERPLHAVLKGVALSVVCDAMLATPLGFNTPQKPYFFLQEFKKGKKTQDDAEGQMLAAMLIAQHQNDDDQPVYGCYLQGKDWYFCTLYQQQYAASRVYDATNPKALGDILHILKKLKYIILQKQST